MCPRHMLDDIAVAIANTLPVQWCLVANTRRADEAENLVSIVPT
jgi:hypothetical protein